MTETDKKEIRFSLIPTIEIIDERSRSFWSRSPSQVEQPVVPQEKLSVPSSQVPKLLSYTPPDTLMFPLFSAIQRKAWVRAKKLCHELILCDPGRTSYLDLYVRLEQITNPIHRRAHRKSVVSQAKAAKIEQQLEQEIEQISN